jgi:hypothetical protein
MVESVRRDEREREGSGMVGGEEGLLPQVVFPHGIKCSLLVSCGNIT